MRSEEIGAFGYLRRLCLASALTAALAITAVSAGAVQVPVDPDAIVGNTEIVSQLSPSIRRSYTSLNFTPYGSPIISRG
jgi:hypothetical protein